MVDPLLKSAQSLDQQKFILRLFQEANKIALANRSVQPVLTWLLQKTVEAMGVEGGLVWLTDDEASGELICQAAYHIWLGHFQVEQRLLPSEGVAGQVIQTGKPIVVSNISTDLRSAPDINALGSGTVQSLIAVPLVFDNLQIGVLEFVNRMNGRFDTHDQELATFLAAAAASIISNARQIQDLQHQVEDLETRNEDLDAFAHSVAHDLQNPLSQIVGFAELLHFKLDELSADEQMYAVKALVTSANKMSQIIQELLLLASVRRIEINVEPLDMKGIVSDALQRLEHLISDYKAELIFPDTWPDVLGYAPWVEEVWENYLSNALKYGGDPPHIELGYARQPYGMIQFWVRDNGEGFDLEVEDELFAPFTKLGRDTQGNERSSGLGLSIVRRIVEKLGGKVAAECIQGQGSVFSFTLPEAKE